tara:strand:- start:637 stop:5268 length:4632 start_codon:yes stop_codon:yes gene_type:complete
MKRLKGINRDTNPMDQPAGTYRYAKNIIVDIEKLCVTSEEGDTSAVFKVDKAIVGYIILADDRLVLFLVDNVETTGESSIAIYNPSTNDYSELFNDSACSSANKLNFSVKFPIEGEYKIDATDDTSIYFTDDNNPPRFMSLDNPPTPSATLDIQTTFNLFPTLSFYPKVLLNRVTAGGTLNAGAYYITCQLVTADGATTNYLDISNPIYINADPETSADTPFGSAEDYSTNLYDGSPPGETSGKKIVVDIHNIDSLNYSFIRPIVISKAGGILQAAALPDVSLGTTSTTPIKLSISYTGFESTSTVNLADIQIPRASYSKAKTIAQVDDVLYLGNLVRSKVDIGYQKYANNIEIHSKQMGPHSGNDTNGIEGVSPNYAHISSPEPVTAFNDPTLGAVTKTSPMQWGFGRNAHDNYYFKGYERDEVYAFYIVWVLKDGSESMAYHIPGRRAVQQNMQNNDSEDERITSSTFSQFYLGVTNDYQGVFGANTTPFMFQLTTEGSFLAGGNKMGFWENQSAGQTYPGTDDYLVFSTDVNGNGVQVDNIQGEKVRHHHFPAESTPNPTQRNATKIRQGGGMIWDGGNHQGYGYTFVNFNPIGFEAKNIPFPNEIKDLVLGYKIYYANRTSENATVIDHGLVHNTGSNSDEGVNVRYATPLSHLANGNPRSLVFDGFHTLTTGDSVEPVSVFKPTRVQTIGGVLDGGGFTGAGTFYAKGVSFYAQNHLGNDISNHYDLRVSIDWTRCRPSDYYGNSHILPFGDTAAPGQTDLTNFIDLVSNFNEISAVVPLKGISYLQAGAVNSSTFPGLVVDNDRGTQTVHMQVEDDYALQSYSGWYSSGSASSTVTDFDDFAVGNNSMFDQTTAEPVSTTQNTISTTANPKANNYIRGGVFGNLYALKDDVYVDYTDQTDLVYTGYFEDTVNTNTHLLNTTTVMGGDVFMGMVAINKRTSFENMSPGSAIDAPFIIGSDSFSGLPNDNGFIHCTHIFPTTSRSHIAMRTLEIDDLNSYFFPAIPLNHDELINNSNGYARDYAFNDDYNAENNVKLLNIYDTNNPLQSLQDFPTRVARSVKFNQSGMTDNFRVFLSGQFRDLPRHRGELWRLEAIKSLLLPHMEKSLMSTQGKEQLSVGSVAAALGSGDLFERDPVEVITTERGEGGTRSQWSGVVSRNGYFYVDTSASKIYLYTGRELEEVSKYGLANFFRDNIINPLTAFGMPDNVDIPTLGLGATAGYDPVYNRYILTYKYLELNTDSQLYAAFISNYNNGNITWDKDNRYFATSNGLTIHKLSSNLFKSKYWTVSYYPALKAWGAFHDYNPELYAYTSNNLYKLYTDTDAGSSSRFHIMTPELTKGTSAAAFRVTDNNSSGFSTYGVNDIEFEFIDNISPVDNKVYSAINWLVDVEDRVSSPSNPFSSENQKWLHETGFTNIFVYNSYQMSREVTITALAGGLNGNCRRLERGWSFNEFRDDAAISQSPSAGTVVSSQTLDMFLYDGMNITQNTNFLDTTKTFDKRKKFVDKYLGIRLLDRSSSGNRNFISLYLADTSKRKSYR